MTSRAALIRLRLQSTHQTLCLLKSGIDCDAGHGKVECAMLNPHNLDPRAKAMFACATFVVAGVIGSLLAIKQLSDTTIILPLLAFYVTLTVNTHSSIRLFSSITPAQDAAQRYFDSVLVIIYLFLAYSLRDPLLFVLTSLFLFITASIKYANLLGSIPHPKLLKRKLTIELCGTLLVAGVVAGTVLDYAKESIWTLAIVFGISNVYWLLINPMYRIID